MLFQKAIRLVEIDNGDCIVDSGNAAQRIIKDFSKLYQEDFTPLLKQRSTTLKSLADYASQMAISQNHLNDTIKMLTGKTPGELIRERTLKESIQLLNHTTLSISEIAFLLQFEDPSYFARFFRKYTGISPKEQRRQTHSV